MPQSEIDDLEAALVAAKAKLYDEISAKFPKWVKVHPTQVKDMPDGSVQTSWPECHKDRDGNVTVLVQNEDEEGQAGEAVIPAATMPAETSPADKPQEDTAQ